MTKFTPTILTAIFIIVLVTAIVTISIYSVNLYIKDLNTSILGDVKIIAKNILANQTTDQANDIQDRQLAIEDRELAIEDRESENQSRSAANESRDLILEGLQNKENITDK